MSAETLYRMVYVSSATQLFTKPQLVTLLERARAANQGRGITGMLLYKDGNFIQLIEGARDQVRALYARIAKDERHRGIEVVFEGDVTERLFSEWSMGFRDLADPQLRSLAGFSDYMNSFTTPASWRRDPQGCLGLLSLFRSTM